MAQVTDDLFWLSFSGELSQFCVGTDQVLRFAPGFSPICSFRDYLNPALDDLAKHSAVGEEIYLGHWTGPPPPGWEVDEEAMMARMVWNGTMPDEPEPFGAVPLGLEHAPQALALALAMHSGPFGIRTLELGQAFGVFDGDRLIAMSGERLWHPPFREVSGVATHPDHQGKGLAGRLMKMLIRRQLSRGEVPFLHVMCENHTARSLYRKLGFVDAMEIPVRVIHRTSSLS